MRGGRSLLERSAKEGDSPVHASSGTPNFLAIATCDEVSLTVLRPDLVLLFADATVCTGLAVSTFCSLLTNLWGNSSLILLSI